MTKSQLLVWIHTREGMAARIDREYGISQAQISRWVNGKRSMCMESEIELRKAVKDIIRKDRGAKQ